MTMTRRSTTNTTKKVAALAAIAAVAIGAAAADSASPDLKVEDVQAPPPPPTSGESKADKIAKLTPKEPWTPSSVKLPANTLADQFASRADFEANWVPSRTQKEDVPAGSDDKDKDLWRYRGNWAVEEPEAIKGSGPGDLGLVMQSPAAHHAISRKLPAPVAFKGKDLVTVQYEVKLQNGLECGGAYLKLLSHDAKFDPAKFSDKSPYTIMFGPDKCGATNKVHFIFRHKNKRTGEVKEHHLRNPPSVPSTFSKESHLYTLLVHPELNTYEIKIDNESKQKGSLLDDFEPPVVPPKEIDDAKDFKPADWVDEAKIPDPEAKKPADWDEDAPLEIEDADAKQPDDWLADEPEYVADPDAKKPEDWDDDEDGEWTAPTVPNPKCADVSGCGKWKRPMIKNPAYKGKWTAPLIDNPKYKGVWKPRKVANPEYVDEKHPGHMTPIGAVGLELWTMQDKILFDNIVVSDSLTPEQLAAWTKDTWVKKHDVEVALIKVEEPETVADADADKAKDGKPVDALDWKAQFAPAGLQKFVTTLLANPSKAVAQFPLVVGALGAMVAVLVTLIVGALFGGSSAPAAKPSASAAKAKAKKAAADKKANATTSSSSSASEGEGEEEDNKSDADVAKASGKKEAGAARKRQASKKDESSEADKDDE